MGSGGDWCIWASNEVETIWLACKAFLAGVLIFALTIRLMLGGGWESAPAAFISFIVACAAAGVLYWLLRKHTTEPRKASLKIHVVPKLNERPGELSPWHRWIQSYVF